MCILTNTNDYFILILKYYNYSHLFCDRCVNEETTVIAVADTSIEYTCGFAMFLAELYMQFENPEVRIVVKKICIWQFYIYFYVFKRVDESRH